VLVDSALLVHNVDILMMKISVVVVVVVVVVFAQLGLVFAVPLTYQLTDQNFELMMIYLLDFQM
jgi:hypothetical protein